MKKFKRWGLLLALLVSVFRCAWGPYAPAKREPMARVGIVQAQDSLEMMPLDRVQILDGQGRALYAGNAGQVWRVTIGSGLAIARNYRLLVATLETMAAANQLANMLRDQRIFVQIRESTLANPAKTGANGFQIWVAKKFKTLEEAQRFQNQIRPVTETTLIEEGNEPSSGYLALKNTETGKEIIAPGPIRLVNARVMVNDLKIGAGFHWEHSKNQTFHPDLELIFDQQGKITLVNILPLETYLSGIVASEMNSGFPLEALKAQAIASRSIALYQKDKKHKNAPFDYCRAVHCQVYGGIDSENERISRAVADSRGLVLTVSDQVIEAPYHSLCGGHTEDPKNVWSGSNPDYLSGKFDVDSDYRMLAAFDLSQEDNLRTWILSSPKVNCNLTQPDIPSELNYARKYFRWEEDYNRAELESIIQSKLGKDIGTLLEVKPLERGVSGRIKKLAINGSQAQLIVEKELEIRRCLSKTHLYSACFIVDTEMGGDGLPAVFRIRGAGWGHGVGLCQIGAAMLAHKGWRAEAILQLYYPGTKISQIY